MSSTGRFKLLSLFLALMLVAVGSVPIVERLTQGQQGGKLLVTIGSAADASGTADFVCDGVNDNVQFQLALNNLDATGGKILVVSSGTFNFGAGVTRAIPNVTIEGTGYGTYITGAASITAGGNSWKIVNLRFDNGGMAMGATTNWIWENVDDGGTRYTLRNPSYSLIGGAEVVGTSITDSGLTAGRVVYAGAAGLLSTDAGLTFDAATNALTVGTITDSALTASRVVFAGVGGLLSDDADLTFSGSTTTATNLNVTTTLGLGTINLTDSGADNRLLVNTYALTRAATYTVAASNASASWLAQADYVCDGTADEVQINAAIAALPAAGGIVQLSEGTFTFANTVTLSTGVTVRGIGAAATIVQSDGSIPPFTLGSGTELRDMTIQRGGAGVAEPGAIQDTGTIQIAGLSNVILDNLRVYRRGTGIGVRHYVVLVTGTVPDSTRLTNLDIQNLTTASAGDQRALGIGDNPVGASSPLVNNVAARAGNSSERAFGLTIGGLSKALISSSKFFGGTGGQDSYGGSLGGSAIPIITDSYFEGGDGAFANNDGLLVGAMSTPILTGVTAVGSQNTGSSASHGLFVEYAAYPTLKSVTAYAGRSSSTAGMYFGDNSSPNVAFSTAGPMPRSTYWDYDDANNGRFRPYADIGYQLVALSVNVNNANVGVTLDLGTGIAGTEICSGLSLGVAGQVSTTFVQVTVAANGYLYATTSAPIVDGDITVNYVVLDDLASQYGVILNTGGFASISNLVARVTSSNNALRIDNAAVTDANWIVSNSTFESLSNGVAISAATALTDAPIYNSHIMGTTTNLTSYDTKANQVEQGPYGLMYYPVVGNYFLPIPVGSYKATGAVTANTIYAAPFLLARDMTLDRIAIYVTVADAANPNGRLGIYSDSSGVPGALVLDAGTINVATTGIKSVAISQSLNKGRYWLAAIFDGTPTVEIRSTSWGWSLRSDMNNVAIYYAAQAYGALPAPFPGGLSDDWAGIQLWVRASSLN